MHVCNCLVKGFFTTKFQVFCHRIRQYGTAQLQGNVCTRAGCIWDVRKMCPERAREASMQVQNLMIKLQQNVRKCHVLFRQTCETSRMCARHVRNACRMHLECVQDASGMCANVTLELSCTICIYSFSQFSATID